MAIALDAVYGNTLSCLRPNGKWLYISIPNIFVYNRMTVQQCIKLLTFYVH